MSRAEVDLVIQVGLQYADEIPNRGILYTWGGDRHLVHTLGGRNETLFHQRYNQPVGGGANGGPGLYLSTNMYDSAEYCPTDGSGVLLQVDMPVHRPMPYIRTGHAPTMTALRNGRPSVQAQMLYRNGDDTPPILLNYSGTWHCLKTTRGVGIRKFDGRAHTPDEIADAVRRIRGANFHVAANVLLGQLRADVRQAVDVALRRNP